MKLIVVVDRDGNSDVLNRTEGQESNSSLCIEL